MRIASYSTDKGEGLGLVVDGGIVDLGRRLGGGGRGRDGGDGQGDLMNLIAAGGLDGLERFAAAEPDHAADAVRYRPVIASPRAKFLCVGLNYRPHILEMGRDVPEHPVIFVRFASSLVGHLEPMILPAASERFDFEGELAVVIGRRARRVPRARALDYVAGYACFNDGSIRDFQRHSSQFTAGKNFVASGAFGPWLVTRDEIPDPKALTLETRLNGRLMQRESTGELHFDIGTLIEYISSWTELEPGDVIATGTPGGVGAGRTPPEWMRAGDTVEVEITGLGCLANPIVAEHAG